MAGTPTQQPRVDNWKEEMFFGYGLDIRSRTIYLGSFSDYDGDETGIDYDVSGIFIKSLKILQRYSHPDDRLTVILNSPGGEWYHGIAIYDAIMLSGMDIIIEVFGHAMSMASIIMQAGNLRLMAPNSSMMIHEGAEIIAGHPENIKRWSKETQRQNDVMYDIYLERIREKNKGYQKKKIKELCQFDTILTPTHAIDLGLADGIMCLQKGVK